MTERELQFFRVLREALPQAQVFSQVSMSAIVETRSKGKEGQAARARFSQKYVDYVICSPNCRVLYVIELDDRSHNSARAKKADATKDEILAKAGIPLRRYSSVKTEVATLAADFQQAVQALSASSTVPAASGRESAEERRGTRIDAP
ncbi:hypothetical protein OR16_04372 [Cupriavidus basilensis OR16]|uniref:DUF2726 domain-containing protein n=2 Tax=Cupriavidus basilensis TaxID=68895 RepID=H1RZW8_9BURK|nr:hypothetical protein OR16_04372 [Cupriavidus basilensis OR16]